MPGGASEALWYVWYGVRCKNIVKDIVERVERNFKDQSVVRNQSGTKTEKTRWSVEGAGAVIERTLQVLVGNVDTMLCGPEDVSRAEEELESVAVGSKATKRHSSGIVHASQKSKTTAQEAQQARIARHQRYINNNGTHNDKKMTMPALDERELWMSKQ